MKKLVNIRYLIYFQVIYNCIIKFLITDFQEEGIVLKNELKKLGYKQYSTKENIFSITNQIHGNTKHKVITILGIKIKFNKRTIRE